MRLILALLGIISATAFAHDLWVEKEGDRYVLFQGHRHSAHEGAEVVPYEPSAIKGFTCVDHDGEARQLGWVKGYPAAAAGDCATLLVTFSTGYWTKTAWETRNVPKAGISGAIKSWYSEESLKFIERWTSSSARPVGTGLEITPTANPFELKVGDKLIVLVTDGGKPVSGVPVAYAGDVRGVSGADGRIAIRLRRGGLQLLQASLETPLNDGMADTAIRTASLQFELAP